LTITCEGETLYAAQAAVSDIHVALRDHSIFGKSGVTIDMTIEKDVVKTEYADGVVSNDSVTTVPNNIRLSWT